jgi:TonB-linked SusC/RagA family outer membrane protein
LQKAAVEDALKRCFSEQPFSYELLENAIVIKNRPMKAATTATSIERSIQGTVRDSTGALPGVSVFVKGKNGRGTVTDANGRYSLKVNNDSEILVFSMLGYISQEVVVENRSTIDVVLKVSTNTLNDVVVVAFGKQKKASITGAIATIQTKELKQSAVSNLSNALVGRLPGLFARQTTGEPGADGSSIWIRGISSFSSDRNPVILVDGVRREGFGLIDPNEVESISILKDAATTSVFGVEGANGVVLVTTKRGSITDKPNVTFNVEKSMDNPTYIPKYLSSADYFRMKRVALINDGKITEADIYSEDFIDQFDRGINWPKERQYEYLYPDVNWFDEITKDFATRTTTNLNVSGGSKKARYFVSGSYLNISGIYKVDEEDKDWNSQAKEDRFNFRSNIDVEINNWISTELSLATIISNRNYPGTNGSTLWQEIYMTPSYAFPVRNPDGSISEASAVGVTNPFARLNESGYSRVFNSYMQGTVGPVFKLDFITPGLSLRDRFSYDFRSDAGYSRHRNYYSFVYNGPNAATPYSPVRTGADFLGYQESTPNYARNMTNELYLNYDRTFGKHTIGGMSLYRIQSNNYRSGDATGALPYRTQSLINRVNYGFNDKYFVEGVLTVSGSENFAPSNRTGIFPALSAGWIISRESFMQGLEWIDYLKLRASGGKVGVQGNTRFAYQSRWNLNTGGYSFGENYENRIPTAGPSVEGNPEATWETETNYNLGMELNLFKNALQIEGDVFYRDRKGIFTTSSRITSGVYGLISYPNINAGRVENKGVELSVTHNAKLGVNSRMRIGLQWSFARNKILDYAEPTYFDRPWQQYTGRRLGEFYGYTSMGYFQNKAEVANSPSQFGNLQPGDIKYRDINGDNIINTLDNSYLGKVGDPEHILGANLNLKLKNWDISLLFQGTLGRSIDIRSDALFGRDWLFEQMNVDFLNNYWTEDSRDAKYPRLSSGKNENNTAGSNFWWRSGDYLRLKNAEIGYNFSTGLLTRLRVKSIRVYANGNNLLTWDHLDGMFDPEVSNNNGALAYPIMRTVQMGLQFNLQ